MQEAQAYSHDGPMRCMKRGHILTMDQSEPGVGTHQGGDVRDGHEVAVQVPVRGRELAALPRVEVALDGGVQPEHLRDYGPIRRRKRGYILTTDPSDAGSAGILSRWTHRAQEAR
eukprot:2085015-Pyramimonas_sp.AAC.1